MSKTNFTKVEKALEEGLQKITADHLLDLADAASNTGKPSASLPSVETRTATLRTLERDLKRLHKKDAGVYKKVGFVKADIKKMIEHPENLTRKIGNRSKKLKKILKLTEKNWPKLSHKPKMTRLSKMSV